MEAPPHDFASLAIIVTDWDALYAKESNTSTPSITKARTSPSLTPIQQSNETGISDVVDEIWSLMSKALKSKLREACVGVLKRTDSFDASEGAFRLDDDARLLD